jgi:hypothetical protein
MPCSNLLGYVVTKPDAVFWTDKTREKGTVLS